MNKQLREEGYKEGQDPVSGFFPGQIGIWL